MEDLLKCLYKKYPTYEHVRYWPVWPTDFYEVVWKAFIDDKHIFIKSFTDKGKDKWKIELDHISNFNKFVKNNNYKFSWPDIYDVLDKWYFHFLMEDVSINYTNLDFQNIEREELIKIYEWCWEIFAEFAEYLWSNVYISEEVVVDQLIDKIDWYSKIIDLSLLWLIDKNLIQDSIKYLKSELYSDSFLVKKRFSFWAFHSAHVFIDDANIKLIDFWHLGYLSKEMEILSLIWSRYLLSVDNYNSYEIWYRECRKTIEDYLNNSNTEYALVFLIMKLLWTIYIDFWDLMIHNKNNILKMKKQWVDVIENAKKWIIWNQRLLYNVIKNFNH